MSLHGEYLFHSSHMVLVDWDARLASTSIPKVHVFEAEVYACSQREVARSQLSDRKPCLRALRVPACGLQDQLGRFKELSTNTSQRFGLQSSRMANDLRKFLSLRQPNPCEIFRPITHLPKDPASRHTLALAIFHYVPCAEAHPSGSAALSFTGPEVELPALSTGLNPCKSRTLPSVL